MSYSKNESPVTVGVIGYPNVGKSGLIESLKQSRSSSISSSTIDSKVKIIDFPGVICENENFKSSTNLRNTIKPEQIADPIPLVEEILEKIAKNDLLLLYKIADYKNITELLRNLAVAKGKVKKVINHIFTRSSLTHLSLSQGGAPNLEIVARMIIQDWNTGKIKYFSHPPQV